VSGLNHHLLQPHPTAASSGPPLDPRRADPFSCQHLSVGIIERSLVGATLWCSNVLISDDGILLSAFACLRSLSSSLTFRRAGKHRKLQPTAAERIVWSQGHATNESGLPTSGLSNTDNLAVAQTSIGKVRAPNLRLEYRSLPLISLTSLTPTDWRIDLLGELHASRSLCVVSEGRRDVCSAFPRSPRRDADSPHILSYTAPTADGRPTWTPLLQTIAQEGRCFVISGEPALVCL
jgi:nitrilase